MPRPKKSSDELLDVVSTAESEESDATLAGHLLGLDAVSDVPHNAILVTDDEAIPDGFLPNNPSPAPQLQGSAPQPDVVVSPGASQGSSLTITPSMRAPKVRPSKQEALEGELLRPTAGSRRYESRIEVVDAWKYPGQFKTAPEWVDRNWAGYAGDYDSVRAIDPGPCVDVPTYRGDIIKARVGDYIVQQIMRSTGDDRSSDQIRVEVWTADQFERLFVDVGEATTQAA